VQRTGDGSSWLLVHVRLQQIDLANAIDRNLAALITRMDQEVEVCQGPRRSKDLKAKRYVKQLAKLGSDASSRPSLQVA